MTLVRCSVIGFLSLSSTFITVLDDPNGIIPAVPSLLPPSTPTPETALLGSRTPLVVRQSDESEPSPFVPPPILTVGLDGMERRGSSNFKDFSAEAEHESALRSPSFTKRLITPLSPAGSDQSTIMAHQQEEFGRQSLSVPLSATTVSYADAGGLLSPHPQSPPRRRPVRRVPVPAPAPLPLDLPTRADVQAAEAVASAEARGLRGGWVMSMEAVSGQNPYSSTTSSRRSTVSTIGDDIGLMTMTASEDKGKKPMRGGEDIDSRHHSSNAVNMVDIDLEGGRNDRFGSNAGSSRYSLERTSGDLPRFNMSRRSSNASNGSGSAYPAGLQIRTPSPLSMIRQNDTTPRPVVGTRNSHIFSENPFEQSTSAHLDGPPVPRKSEDIRPEVPAKEKSVGGKNVDDTGADMQEVAI